MTYPCWLQHSGTTIRISKSKTKPKSEIPMVQTTQFRISKFEMLRDFEIRISDCIRVISVIRGSLPFHVSPSFSVVEFFGKFANLPELGRVFVGDDRIQQLSPAAPLPGGSAIPSSPSLAGQGQHHRREKKNHDSLLHACAAPVGCGQARGRLARGYARQEVHARLDGGGSPHPRPHPQGRQLEPPGPRPRRQALPRARTPGPEEGAPGGQALRLAGSRRSPRRLDQPAPQLEGQEAALHPRCPRRLAALLPHRLLRCRRVPERTQRHRAGAELAEVSAVSDEWLVVSSQRTFSDASASTTHHSFTHYSPTYTVRQ